MANSFDMFDMLESKPKVRGDCKGGFRPCPWVSCRYNVMIDVLEESGGLVLNADIRRPEARGRSIVPKEWSEELFRDQLDDAIDFWFDEPDATRPSCALDEADRVGAEGMQLDEISDMMFVTRERVRQIEAEGLALLRYISDYANLNPNNSDDDHEHVRYVCRRSGCGCELAACPCELPPKRKRTEISHRLCPACREIEAQAQAQERLIEVLQDRAESLLPISRCG